MGIFLHSQADSESTSNDGCLRRTVQGLGVGSREQADVSFSAKNRSAKMVEHS
jgi:hypothetical protein